MRGREGRCGRRETGEKREKREKREGRREKGRIWVSQERPPARVLGDASLISGGVVRQIRYVPTWWFGLVVLIQLVRGQHMFNTIVSSSNLRLHAKTAPSGPIVLKFANCTSGISPVKDRHYAVSSFIVSASLELVFGLGDLVVHLPQMLTALQNRRMWLSVIFAPGVNIKTAPGNGFHLNPLSSLPHCHNLLERPSEATLTPSPL